MHHAPLVQALSCMPLPVNSPCSVSLPLSFALFCCRPRPFLASCGDAAVTFAACCLNHYVNDFWVLCCDVWCARGGGGGWFASTRIGSLLSSLSGSRMLTAADIEAPLAALEEQLMKKNVASEIARLLCRR